MIFLFIIFIIGKSKKTTNYLRQIEANYHSLLNHAEINDDFNLDDYVGYSESQKKNIVHETYLKCFGSGLSNDIKYLYRLGVFYKNYDKKCINYVFDKKYANEDMSSKLTKTRKSEIAKNFKGAERFRIFSERLKPGVYQLVNLSITYFVKIQNKDWNNFYYGRKQDASFEDDEEEGEDEENEEEDEFGENE